MVAIAHHACGAGDVIMVIKERGNNQEAIVQSKSVPVMG